MMQHGCPTVTCWLPTQTDYWSSVGAAAILAGSSAWLIPSSSAWCLRWSPDRRLLRFNVSSAVGESIWEVSGDGSNPHALLPGWHPTDQQFTGDGPSTASCSYFRPSTTGEAICGRFGKKATHSAS